MITSVIKHLSNLPGWRTRRKIVVFESDDWGSIRMPSRKAFEALQAAGVPLTGGDSSRYNLYDTLATEEDLQALFDVLQSVKDKTGKPAVFTPMTLVANPDFERIAASDFQEYFYEPLTETLERYHGHRRAFDLWKEGMTAGIFMPQFHGREHLNVSEWMRALQTGDPLTKKAFDQGVWGFNNVGSTSTKVAYQAAFDVYDPADLPMQSQIITEGLHLFEQLFGYRARFFVPPNGPFNQSLENIAAKQGIRYMSTAKWQRDPIGNGKIKRNFRYLGKTNRHGQMYLTRNGFFEPSQTGIDWIRSCLEVIRLAFFWKKPAVISSHRVNYIGVHDENNRKRGLSQLSNLLQTIVQTWPEVEFMTSDQLGDAIVADRNADTN